ncbi:sensor histidine kinase [Butyrivibrio sp. AE2015]|uniref:sensor histidine kinase n=1 Tax=Butyrivibrio sp. AE2015 TaxID=1280663 RepID=UPI0003B4E903|nr:HAMP domain-containing sensor histidine kinase [Butyrivibrio sp. AE2015]
MVKKLRKKFVVTAMLSLLLILVIMIGVINIINVRHVISEADRLLTMLENNDGYFPGMKFDDRPEDSSQFSSEEEIQPTAESSVGNEPNPRPMNPTNPFQFDKLNSNRDAEMPYQSRYFWVRLDASNNVTEINLGHIASVTENVASEYAIDVANNAQSKGFYHTYRYVLSEKNDGTKLVIFSDQSAAILNMLTLLLQSVLVGLCALIAMFILVFIFSSQAVAPVVESLEKQKRFITDAGHELKTPLAVISANVDVLELESGKSEWTTSIKNQVTRMNGLVKNLLTLSRMDEERMHVVFSDFDMSKTVKDTAVSFEALATSKGKKYQMDIEDGIHITGDKNAINQLASLLLDNAMKYSSEKGSIHVLLTKGNKYITFEVSNTCDAIPSGNLDRLFDRFYRADSSRARETGGYGIGLSVARAIATSHGGSIEALRDGDKIIRFVVTLPKELPKNLQKMN